MSVGASNLFERLFAALSEQSGIKTWSLIVTIFGDLAPNKGECLDSQVLGKICETFGIKPEALRVALHRLRKDDWLVAQKRGRHSAYFLSERGRQSTAEAYERIYRSPREAASKWRFTFIEGAGDAPQGSIALFPNCFVSHLSGKGFGFDSEADEVPRWMKAVLSEHTNAQELKDFEQAIKPALVDTCAMNDVQKLFLRLLLLHYWRRILLRMPDATELLLGQDWPGFGARALIFNAFETLPKPSIQDLPKWVVDS